jgi:hypothetical protein
VFELELFEELRHHLLQAPGRSVAHVARVSVCARQGRGSPCREGVRDGRLRERRPDVVLGSESVDGR